MEETGAIRAWGAEAILIRARAVVILTRDKAEEEMEEEEEETGAVVVAEGQTSQVTWTPERCGN
jgi:hypothetical protein